MKVRGSLQVRETGKNGRYVDTHGWMLLELPPRGQSEPELSCFTHYMSGSGSSPGCIREYPHHFGPELLTSGSGLGYKPPKKLTASPTSTPKLPNQTFHHCSCSASAGPGSGERRKTRDAVSLLPLPCAICRLSSLQTLNCPGNPHTKRSGRF